MRAEIELSRREVLRLRNYCRKHHTFWCVAKDRGAYVCAPRGPTFYFKGCNPDKDPFDTWWANTRKLFGGDDFGENLPIDWLEHVAKDITIVKLRVIVTHNHVAAEFEKA